MKKPNARFKEESRSIKEAVEKARKANAGRAVLPAVTSQPREHGPPQRAVEIPYPFGFPVTDLTVGIWIVAAGLVILSRVAIRGMKQVLSGVQNLLEWLVGGLYSFLESVIGPHLVKWTFWSFRRF